MKKEKLDRLLSHPAYKNNKFLQVHFEVAIKKVNDLLSKDRGK